MKGAVIHILGIQVTKTINAPILVIRICMFSTSMRESSLYTVFLFAKVVGGIGDNQWYRG